MISSNELKSEIVTPLNPHSFRKTSLKSHGFPVEGTRSIVLNEVIISATFSSTAAR